ncbi:hypothetical protein tca_00317 [Methanothermobacter sp. EMTCatA1]|jgi:GT2 family glycosyltransferase|nr:hypothetical protein tca_00317 [Methanothermobacter sp. EMTCatA1]
MVSGARLIKKVAAEPDFNWKTFYHLRNVIYLDRKYGENILVRYLRPMRTLIILTYQCLKYKPSGFRYLLKAFWEGYTLKRGKTVKPGEF